MCLALGSVRLRPISSTDLAHAFVFVLSSRCFPFSSIPFLLSPREIGKGAMAFVSLRLPPPSPLLFPSPSFPLPPSCPPLLLPPPCSFCPRWVVQ